MAKDNSSPINHYILLIMKKIRFLLFTTILPALLLLCLPPAHSADSKQDTLPKEQTAPTGQEQPSTLTETRPEPSATPSDEKPTDQGIAPLPSSTEMTTSYESAFVRMLVTLFGLVFLVFATFWMLRRMGKGKFKMGSGRSINVIEKRALSPKSMLYVIEIGNKKVLLSESQLEVRTLTTIEELPEQND
jgi:flagellar biogenesis protein FliO